MFSLVPILKDCPEGTKLYCPLCGTVVLKCVYTEGQDYPIETESVNTKEWFSFTPDGRYYAEEPDAECLLFPSKDCRDWTKFKQLQKMEFKKGDHILWNNTSDNMFFGLFDKFTEEGQCVINLFDGDHLKSFDVYIKDLTRVEKFDPKWLNTGDNVLVRDRNVVSEWCYSFFSHITFEEGTAYFIASCSSWQMCIPYNYETKHLVGTQDDAPEFYRK